MASSRKNMSMDTELAFKEFSKNISYCIFNRIIGIISLLLIIASWICLLLCYWLLTCSKYVQHITIDICEDMDLFCVQSVAHYTIQHVSDTINDCFGTRSFVSKSNIKSEFASMLERHLAPDWATDLETDSTSEGTSDEDNHPVNEDDVEIKKEPIVLIEKLKNESNEDSSDSSNESNKEDSDEEVEDVTEKILAEMEKNKIVLDLTNEDEANSYMTI
ncbi:hypothetical protein N9K75_02035 [bacterium]|nr:hypothetical protein [bacterium]